MPTRETWSISCACSLLSLLNFQVLTQALNNSHLHFEPIEIQTTKEAIDSGIEEPLFFLLALSYPGASSQNKSEGWGFCLALLYILSLKYVCPVKRYSECPKTITPLERPTWKEGILEIAHMVASQKLRGPQKGPKIL